MRSVELEGTLLMPLGIHPTVDFVFKLLFGDTRNVDLLIHLLNSVLDLEHPIVEVTILNPFNDKEFDDDKLSIVDIKARDSTGAGYIIEVQTTLPAGLRNRLAYYTSGLYYSQMREGGSYGELRPAISVCFLNDPLFKAVNAGHLSFSLCDPLHGVTYEG
jgi:predicted transposase/invertase (TIGR01784 family)